jgi:hypothetical protein
MDTMTVDQLVTRFPEYAATVAAATLRQWRKRGGVPLHVTKGLLGDVSGRDVAEPVTPDADDVTPATAADLGYVVGRPHSLDAIRGIVASGRRAAAAAEVRRAKGLDVVTVGQRPEFDVLADGWVRGLPGDTNLMRKHRTDLVAAFAAKGVDALPLPG